MAKRTRWTGKSKKQIATEMSRIRTIGWQKMDPALVTKEQRRRSNRRWKPT